jgi:glycogen debranching enzyme
MITYALDQIPFSTRGSFLLITSHNSNGLPRLVYKTCSSRIHQTDNLPFPAEEFFELSLVKDGQDVSYNWQTSPHRLDLRGETGEMVSFVFADSDTLLFRADNVSLRLIPCKYFPVEYSPADNQIYLIDWVARGFHMIRTDENATLHASKNPILTNTEKHQAESPSITLEPNSKSSTFYGEIRFSRYETSWDGPMADFNRVQSVQEKDFTKWINKLPKVPESYQIQAEIAWFILWNCQVSKDGALVRPALYMSKSCMNGIWAWDNLFNAIAVADADPQLAWDQVMLFFDLQDPNGMLPDMINDMEPIYGFTKPPIHGWAIRKLVNKLGIKKSLPFLSQIYKPLSRLTNWWYTFRDFDHDGMAQYLHGNDSGWDNSTVFDQGYPVEGADLAAYLILQCESLAFIAETIGRKKVALRWKNKADQQLTDLLSHSVKDDHFYSPLSGSHVAEESRSLINYLPIILGKRLPKQIRKALIADLGPEGPYLTSFGLASEPPSSTKYIEDGYWRGPIWAASTYLIFDGLIASGEFQLGKLIAQRFCNMCRREPGFWENYDALTGKGLRCPGYSWTASVFLLLAEWLESNSKVK